MNETQYTYARWPDGCVGAVKKPTLRDETKEQEMIPYATFVRLAPVVLRIARVVVLVAPHVVTIYQYRKEIKLLKSRKRLK